MAKTKGESWQAALAKEGLTVQTASAVGAIRGWINTGNYALNYAVSGKFQHGWPLGHVTEIHGDPSTGKSYLLYRCIAAAHEDDKTTALLDDTEGAFNLEWAAYLGIDTNRLYYTHSHTVLEHMKVLEAYLGAHKRGLIALDSLARLTTEHELENPEKVSLARAKDLHKLFRVMGARISQADMAYVVANHHIANIGNIYQPTTTPGGGALKYQASVRVGLRLGKKFKDDRDDIVAQQVHATVDKNRVTVPFRKCTFIIPFYQPINPYSGLLPILLKLSVVADTGRHTLQYKGEDTGIKTYNSDPLRQDESAYELCLQYGDILDVADKYLEQLAEVRRTSTLEGEEVEDDGDA